MNDKATVGAGVLYVVATPIGNLGDITARALETLRQVTVIAAEDTRHARHLLTHFGIQAELIACHEHNETESAPKLLARLENGQNLALVSDAGTPLISDPGFVLVRMARERGLRVVPIPGPNAAICALSAAGLPSDRFLFLGFPPRTSAKCREWLAGVVGETGTLIFYESGKRAERTLGDLAAVFGSRQAVVARELTKHFETFLSGDLNELAGRIAADEEQRLGELVLLVAGAESGAGAAQAREEERVLDILAAELPLKQAATLAARITGGSKNRLYRMGLSLSGEERRPGEPRGTD